VLRVKARGQRDLVIVVGHARHHRVTHGLQCKTAFLGLPTMLEGIDKYLGSGMTVEFSFASC
jgi:exodeoxyribonuclease V alpha subunit